MAENSNDSSWRKNRLKLIHISTDTYFCIKNVSVTSVYDLLYDLLSPSLYKFANDLEKSNEVFEPAVPSSRVLFFFSRTQFAILTMEKQQTTMKSLVAVLVLFASPVLGYMESGYEIIPRSNDRHLYLISESPTLPSFDGDLEAIVELALAKAERGSGSSMPSDAPSIVPSTVPSSVPAPTSWGGLGNEDSIPSDAPSLTPSAGEPTDAPSIAPTTSPSSFPSDAPSLNPTLSPYPTDRPSISAPPSTSVEPTHYSMINPHACASEESTDSTLIVTYWYSLETVPQADINKVRGEGEEILQEQIAKMVLECLNPTASDASIIALDSFPFDQEKADGMYPTTCP